MFEGVVVVYGYAHSSLFILLMSWVQLGQS